jgi:exosortase E/protease (VPEID-CTERM system)
MYDHLGSRAPVRSFALRVLIVGALVAGEGALLAGRFDAHPLLARGEAWWIRGLAHAGYVMPLALAIVTALAMIAGPAALGALAAAQLHRRRLVAWLAAHFASFFAFFRLTGSVFESVAPSAFLAAAWASVGLMTAATAMGLVVDWRSLRRHARRAAMLLAAGVAVGVLAWGAGRITETWWHPLGRGTMWSVYALVTAFSDEAIVDPSRFVVGTRAFRVEIAPGCSGYEGIGLIWVFLSVFLFAFRRSFRFPRALVVLPAATAVIWLANAARIAALIGIGATISPAIAVGGFHANSGSLLLCIVALSFAWAASRSPWLAARGEEPVCDDAPDSPVVSYVMPLVVLLATAMVTGIVASGSFDPLYGLRIVTVAAALWIGRRHYRELLRGWSWRAPAVGAAVFAAWIALEPLQASASGESVIAQQLAALPAGAGATWIVVRAIGSITIVPIAEELAFRGYLARRLVSRRFEDVSLQRLGITAIFVSSLLFGIMHQRLIAGTMAGAAYALAAKRSGSLADALVAHATTNALLAAWIVLTGDWGLW